MQPKSIFSIFSLSAIAAAGDFSATCKDMQLMNGHILNAWCPGDGFDERSFLDLNKCYAVVEDASIVPRKDGDFYARCDNCSVTLDGVMLCVCWKQEGGAKTVEVDLNERISNINGHTHCDVEDGGYAGECTRMFNGDVDCDDERVTN